MAYELLSSEERRLLARLSVFRGGFTLEAAEDVCDARVGVLSSLADKGLVRHSEGRFWLPQNVRTHAGNQLDALSEANGLRARHAEHFLAHCELAVQHDQGRSKGMPARLDLEQANLAATLDWLQAAGDTQNALLVAAVRVRLTTTTGSHAHARRWLETTLAADTDATEARALALDAASELALDVGDVATGRAQAHEALSIRRFLGDVRGAAHSTFILGRLEISAGDLDAAALLFKESLEDLEAHTLDCLVHFAFLHALGGRGELATLLVSSSLALQQATELSLPFDQLQMNAATLTRIREQLDEPAFMEAWERGRRLTLAEAVALARDETLS
ncbi:MAG: Signal transduction response regulator / Disease resistance protein [Thermoleophilia bacterium]|nr:Signal transduction response regulator / Disease resistance protein [Thermoleophilia bacterium]